MNDALNNLLNVIGRDYSRLFYSRERQSDVDDFYDNLSYKIGSKYAKIISNGSAWGFVVVTDNDKKFPKGTILKAASWSAPARNAARGNVLTEDFSMVAWTGPAYLNNR